MKTVTVIDYGIGNLHNVVKALRHLGADVTVTSDARDVPPSERLVLPGVGAFRDGVAGLVQRGLFEHVARFAETERPLLGICLGMQLLLNESEEFGTHRGLGVIPGRVRAIPPTAGLKVPQIGWNRIFPRAGATWADTPLAAVAPGSMVYFDHSYTAVPSREEDRLADSDYGGHCISAAVRRGSVWGCQFHPELSGATGLSILGEFLAA